MSDSVVRPATACSALSQTLGEPLAGTAAAATTWLCIEQPGPWGRDAVLESHLDKTIGAELTARAKGSGVRLALIRRPGRSESSSRELPRRQVYLAHTMPGRTWLERIVVNNPKELLQFDFAALGAGVAPGVGEAMSEPMFLVCTNGRRDECCARVGRPIAATLAARYGERVWECTHTGGHRFAPTGVVLPVGYLYGRLTVDAADRILRAVARGEAVVDGCRGRSTWTPAGQVAELAVRDHTGEPSADGLTVTAVEQGSGTYTVDVRDRAGTTWRVDVESRELDPARPTSCHRDAVVPTGLFATAVRALV